MILVLTYHKVLPKRPTSSEFYNTSADNLERHLQLLTQSRLRGINPHHLASESSSTAATPFVLTFDDATQDHYEFVLPLLSRFGQKAIFFVPTSKLNRPGYLSGQAVADLSSSGHVIGSHSHDHQRMDSLPEEDVHVQIQLSCDIIERIIGMRPKMFAPPGGFMNGRVRQAALDAGMQVIRTMRWGYNRRPDLTALSCVPVHRYMTEREFQRVLQFRSRALTYTMKQAAKRLLPGAVYVSLRDALLGWLRGK